MLSALLLATIAAVSEEPTWMVGSGLRYEPSVNVGMASLLCRGSCTAGAYLNDDRLGLSVALEGRLSDRLWLMFLATGGYRKSESGGVTSGTEDTIIDVGASAGPRFALTEDLPVELALYGVLNAGYASAEFVRQSKPESKSQAKAIGARFGLTFDRSLTDGLGVRLGLNLLALEWLKSSEDVSGAEYDSLAFGVRPEASLLLTMSL